MVSAVPGVPELELKDVITGPTVKGEPLLASPATVTTIFPVVPVLGIVTVMLVVLQVLAAPAGTPLNVTVLFPWLAPKFNPVMVSAVPAFPELALRAEIAGATVKAVPLLAAPETVTTMLPVVAPVGTLIVMLFAFQALDVPAEVPLKVTVLLPWLAPKFEPLMVMVVPAAAEDGLTPLIVGVGGGGRVVPPPLLPPPPPPPQFNTNNDEKHSTSNHPRRCCKGVTSRNRLLLTACIMDSNLRTTIGPSVREKRLCGDMWQWTTGRNGSRQ